jgi:uncharacterized protein (TIGR04255 family)
MDKTHGCRVQRPSHLPDFSSPPLDEVVLGVQFVPVSGYQSIHAWRVWDLFRSEFPLVQEQPPIAPAFETFGLPQAGKISFEFMSAPPHSRFWFLSKDNDELIQFQSDRLLHNWRKVGDKTNEYPRFEAIIEKFERELLVLQDFFQNFRPGSLQINQCEISYVNKIDLLSDQRPEHWLRFVSFNELDVDDFSTTFRRILVGEDQKPRGRLICEASSGGDAKGRKIISLSLTARGTPESPNISGALDFLKQGRETVVAAFGDVTTNSAHQTWGRI